MQLVFRIYSILLEVESQSAHWVPWQKFDWVFLAFVVSLLNVFWQEGLVQNSLVNELVEPFVAHDEVALEAWLVTP